MHLDGDTLQALVDGELPAPDRSVAEEHLALCPECAGRLATLRGLVAMIESVPEETLAADLSGMVVAKLEPRVRLGRRARWAVLAELTLGIASGILAAGWLSGQLSAWQTAGLALIEATAGLGDPTAWFQSGWMQAEMTLSSMVAGLSSSTTVFSLAVPVTTWMGILAGIVLLGGLANGVILRRLAQSNHRAA